MELDIQLRQMTQSPAGYVFVVHSWYNQGHFDFLYKYLLFIYILIQKQDTHTYTHRMIAYSVTSKKKKHSG